MMRAGFLAGGVLRTVIGFILLFCLLASCGESITYIDWQKCLGGSDNEEAGSTQQTNDGGYIAAGYTTSNDSDVIGHYKLEDCWVVKLSQARNLEWQKCWGGSSYDYIHDIQQTNDGGYIAAGFTYSNDNDVIGNHGLWDCLVVKLNQSGNLTWQKCLGGSQVELAYSAQQTADGGYIVAGSASSNNGDVSGNHSGQDYWVVKLNASGNLTWQKCLGGSGNDEARSIQQTADGGYVVAGYTSSKDGDVQGNHGNFDFWIVKLNQSGNLEWQKCLGGRYDEQAQSVQQTADGGYVVAGYAVSNDGDVSGNHGSNSDYWVVKLDPSGNLTWQKCLGGSQDEYAKSIQQTADGGYVVVGYTYSNDGDVSGNHGQNDYWVVKLNQSGNMEWQKCVGGRNDE